MEKINIISQSCLGAGGVCSRYHDHENSDDCFAYDLELASVKRLLKSARQVAGGNRDYRRKCARTILESLLWGVK